MLGLAILGDDAAKPPAEKKKTPQELWLEQISQESDEPLVDPMIVKGAFLAVGVSALIFVVARAIR